MLKYIRVAAALLLVLLSPACGNPRNDASQANLDETASAPRETHPAAAMNDSHGAVDEAAQSSSAAPSDHASPVRGTEESPADGPMRLVAAGDVPGSDAAKGIRSIPPTAAEPTSADLHAQDAQFSPGAYRLLSSAATTGRFPAGVAIARLRVELTADNARRLQFDSLLNREAARWNGFANDVPAVREVVFSAPHGLAPDQVDLADLIRSSIGLRCGLCLTYVRWGEPIYDMRQFGVLWDARTLEALATFDVSAAVSPPDYEQCWQEEPEDERRCRADDLAEQAFEQQVLMVLYDLAQHDTHSTATQPNPWQTDRPLFPRDDPHYYGPRLLDPRFWRR